MKEYIVTVMAPDRTGIVHDISGALCSLDGNITHLSQTVLRGYFTLIISAEFPDDKSQLEIRQALERNGEVGEFEVNVRPYIPNVQRKSNNTQLFVLSMQGDDRKGIIASTTQCLSEHNINVEDLYSYVVDGKLLVLAQVSVPDNIDIELVRLELENIGKQFNLIVHFMHENIFKATSEVKQLVIKKESI
ncbi:MAG: ACT domain-containing protein [Armatimonadota bacterium]